VDGDETLKLITHSTCPECNRDKNEFTYDDIRDEIVCKCGLVLSGPPGYVAGIRAISYPYENRYCYQVGDRFSYYASYGSLNLSGRSLADRKHLSYDPLR
jgi:hypothetical protein